MKICSPARKDLWWSSVYSVTNRTTISIENFLGGVHIWYSSNIVEEWANVKFSEVVAYAA